MKKTSILLASSIMILAVIVAIVGVTAAWFGNQYTYNGAVVVSSANPTNGAIIVQGSASELPTGKNAILTPAKILPGLVLNDIDGSKKYYDLNVLEPNEDVLSSIATKVTVTFDFVYNGAAPNEDGTVTMYIQFVSVTLKNPHYYVDKKTGEVVDDPENYDGEIKQMTDDTLTNYRDEFKVNMFVTTADSSVEMFNSDNKYSLVEVHDEDDNVVNSYYLLEDKQYTEKEGYQITFDMLPVTHTLNAELYFAHIDELTPPELIDAQLFLNFKVVFVTTEGE